MVSKGQAGRSNWNGRKEGYEQDKKQLSAPVRCRGAWEGHRMSEWGVSGVFRPKLRMRYEKYGPSFSIYLT